MTSGYNIRDLEQEAQVRWLKPPEVFFILQNFEEDQLTQELPQKPPSGSLFLFNRRVLRFFRKDGHSWRKKKDGRTAGEAHERLKVGNVEALNCYYAHGEQNPNFQRRIYWMLDSATDDIVLVHYRDLTVVRTPKSSLESIISATNNFGDENYLGRDGFGYLYRDVSNKGQRIKRLHRSNLQEDSEFLLEISNIKHENLATLVGFCDESDERIIIYKYESRGSLERFVSSADLTWIMRLQIGLGVAHGLSYLHNYSSTQQAFIHGDFKISNILLDENWEAKTSDFGLYKIGPRNEESTFLVSNAMGAHGHVDPMYMETGFLSKESDVYSFGVVLFEILCGRLAIEEDYDDEERFLPLLAQRYYEKDKMVEIVDPFLRKQMGPNALSKFSNIAYECLKKERGDRPSMNIIVQTLETLLEFEKPRQVRSRFAYKF